MPDPELETLQNRIDAAQSKERAEQPKAAQPSPVDSGPALRLSVELFAGIVVGGVIGFYLDRWLGIAPWCMLVFIFLGAAAGFRNLIRAGNRDDLN